MRSSRLVRLLFLSAALLVAREVRPQQPFDLDTVFRTGIDTWYVSSVAPLPDGRIFLSGQIQLPGETGSFRGAAMLHPDGERDMSFPNFPFTTGGGKITPWNGQYYVATSQSVRRLDENCLIDPSFIIMNLGPYFSSLQGGDYHVYPDGRILMSGVHGLNDPVRGFVGDHCLIWFSNTGYLDTTKSHRKCAGSLDIFRELPNGQFIGSLGNPPNTASWEGQPTGSNVIRFDADGAWDPGFQANVWWGTAYGFLPLEDGRVYVGGNFRIAGLSDTLNLVRLLPDGSLDPTFNNTVKYREPDPNYPENPPEGIVRSIHHLSADKLIVTGNFGSVGSEPRGGIALIDTSGELLSDLFAGNGCGGYNYQASPFTTPYYYRVITNIVPAPDGSYYICGAYHGYDDGTTNDTLQRMVSRLHGLNVGIQGDVGEPILVRPYPNPGSDHVRLSGLRPEEQVEVRFLDASGRAVSEHRAVTSSTTIFVGDLSAGMYVILVTSTHHTNVRSLWLKQ
jgi:hypothetical protein